MKIAPSPSCLDLLQYSRVSFVVPETCSHFQVTSIWLTLLTYVTSSNRAVFLCPWTKNGEQNGNQRQTLVLQQTWRGATRKDLCWAFILPHGFNYCYVATLQRTMRGKAREGKPTGHPLRLQRGQVHTIRSSAQTTGPINTTGFADLTIVYK